MTPTIYNINGALYREKIAAFDYDWTLVSPKDGKTFPSNVDDWKWLYPSVPQKIKQYYSEGYMIVIFTNQSKLWKHEQIKLVAEKLEIPVFIVVATDKSDYKPNPNLYISFLQQGFCTITVDKNASFFVGDALGGKSDFSDSDKVFAENIGVSIYSPESVFGGVPAASSETTVDISQIPLLDGPQIIIMMGFPGSGKSTIAKQICKDDNYVYIEGDVYKTSAKMTKAALDPILKKKSVIFDATNSSSKKRKEYVDFAKKHNYPVVCIHVTTSLEIAYKRNKSREAEKQVPKIAYSVYSKHYEEPCGETEGFRLVKL